MVFVDNLPSSPSYGKQVESCPGCGRELKLRELRSESYPVEQG